MTDQNERATPSPASDPTGGVNQARRRRLLTGTAAGAGVFLAMQAKTALGVTKCQSPSAMISGNQSPRPGDGHVCSGGRSPGFWVQPQHFPYWIGLSYPTFSSGITVCSTGLGNVSPCDIVNKGTLVGSLFAGAPGATKGIWEVIMWPTNYPTYTGANCTGTKNNTDVFGGKGQLLRHLSCAYLNAAYFGSASQDYPITTQQVIDMWNAVKNGGLYCPTGMTCGGGGMSADQIIAYISGMYDINEDVPNLCKTV